MCHQLLGRLQTLQQTHHGVQNKQLTPQNFLDPTTVLQRQRETERDRERQRERDRERERQRERETERERQRETERERVYHQSVKQQIQ